MSEPDDNVTQFPRPVQESASTAEDELADDLTRELLTNIDRVRDIVNKIADNKGTDRLEREKVTLERDRQRLVAELGAAYDQLDRLTGLYIATRNLHGSLQPHLVQRTIAEIAINLLGAQSFALLLREGAGFTCDIVETESAEEFLTGAKYEGGDPQIDGALRDGAARFGPFPDSNAVAVVPMQLQDTVVGALVLFKLFDQKESLNEADRDLLDVLAAHSATALAAAHAFARTSRRLETMQGLMHLGASDEPDTENGPNFSGSIRDLPLPELIQFLHYGSRTGTLALSHTGEHGYLVFNQGNIIGAQGPDGHTLAEQLVKDGLISSAAMVEHQTKARDLEIAVGVQIIDSGGASLGDVLASARRHVHRKTRELLAWQNGTFEFLLDETDTERWVGLPAPTLSTHLQINTQMMLLDALRESDEASASAAAGLPPPELEEAPMDSPLDPPTTSQGSEFTPATDAEARDWYESLTERAIEESFERALQQIPSPRSSSARTHHFAEHIRSVVHAVRASMTTSSVAAHMMDVVSAFSERAVLFVVRPGELHPLGAFGHSMLGKPLGELTDGMTVKTGDGAVARAISDGRLRNVGSLETGLERAFLERIGFPTRDRVALVPVVGSQRTILLVYADNGNVDEDIVGLELLDLVAIPAGLAFENELLKRRIRSPS